MNGTATITVSVGSWDEERVVEADDQHAVARATYTTELTGDLQGTSTATLLLSYVRGTADDPHSLEGPYVGYEQLTGTLDGRTGTFVLALRGAHTGGVARTEAEVVADSGTGGLAGISGTGGYAAGGATYTMRLDYRIGD
ncbi:DUF3224 domain-containing protein [uncultured Jatrophihabitans sp.]|uniref:DUF3224 domain-containing protein n=1 Tax=uncultured Jatrophihabitans sp. TaxID=1610747 RepID=UPI0035CA9024